MILSAMMFALGVFVTGLLALWFCVALVRRTRRVTERRLMAAVSARRAEFEAERDELRARHAVQMHRLERELARVLDMATAHRLDADVKDRDLLNVQAELKAKDDEIQELQERLGEHREALQEAERKYAEASTSLRAARHALKLESRRRAAMEEPLDQALALADEKKVELSALQAQVQALRQSLSADETGPAPADTVSLDQAPQQSRVIPLPVRPRPGQIAEAETGWSATEASAGVPETGTEVDWSIPVTADDSDAAGDSWVPVPEPDRTRPPAANAESDGDDKSETLFVEALAEIRALKRAAGSQAAE